MITSKNIFIIAGEASGDQHAANYVKQHLIINPDIKFTAIGQQELKKEGAKIIYDSEKISVVGIIEVLVKYRLIKHALNIAYKHIKEDKPDLNSCVHALDEFVAQRSKRFSYLYFEKNFQYLVLLKIIQRALTLLLIKKHFHHEQHLLILHF